jgi:flagellar basal-body rod protein FlgF
MIRGLVSAARGMLQQTFKQDVIANNLANVSTTGYKRRTIAFSSFASALAQESSRESAGGSPRLEAAVADPRVTTHQDESQGALQMTGDKTNLAINGPGFFVVQSSGGQELTRNGSFTLNGQGEIITPSGAKLMGKAGPIKVDAPNWQIDSSGRVISGGTTLDHLKIVARDQTGVTTDVPDGQIRVVQGSLETSNVSPMREMINMIANLRAYEANQKSIQAIDHTLDKLINEAGKV